MKPFRYLLLAGGVPVLVTLYIPCFRHEQPEYTLINFVLTAVPQILWWSLCIFWWGCWGPATNRGLLIGGIVLVDLLLLYVAFSPGEADNWLYYFLFSPVAVALGGLAGGICGKLLQQPQPGAPPLNGGPLPPAATRESARGRHR